MYNDLVLYNAPWIKGLEPSLLEPKDSCQRKTIHRHAQTNDNKQLLNFTGEGGKEGRKDGRTDGGKERRREGAQEGRSEGGKERRSEGGKEGGRCQDTTFCTIVCLLHLGSKALGLA